MPRVPLLDGAYQSRALISTAQRCINLYPEVNADQQAPTPVTHFPTPGLRRMGTPPASNVGRCVYRASDGDLYAVIGGAVYFVDRSFNFHQIGTIPALSTPVVMADNGFAIILVDGTSIGYAINMKPPASRAFAPINDPNFFGGSHVAYVDTFFIVNDPNLNQWRISLAIVTFANLTQGVITAPALFAAFDPLDYTGKIGSADYVVGLVAMHRNLWIFGTLTAECWYNSGGADFVFATLPGVYSERGCEAPYSIATEDNAVYWLSRSRQGQRVVLRWLSSYQIETVSTPGIEAILGAFPVADDAIGGAYSLLGHSYYVITFPTAGRSFAVETNTKQWHELAWTGPNRLERHRGRSWCNAYDMVLTIDRENGTIYQLDPFTYTDDGGPITRVRTIPHILNDGKRVRVDRVIADTQGGRLAGTSVGPYSKSVQQLITELGLPAPKLLLEAGTTSSWSGGTSQKWLDESGGGYDFFLGDSTTVSTNDPAFNGSLGGQSLSESWNFDGGDYFTYDAANEAWMNNLHKDGAKFTLMVLVNPSNVSVQQGLIGDVGTVTGPFNVGFRLSLAPGAPGVAGTFGLAVGNGAGVVLAPVSPPVLLPGEWHTISVTVDESAGTGFYGTDEVTTPFVSTYAAPSAAAAATPMQIGTQGAGIFPLLASTRIAFVAIWEGVALTEAQVTALGSAIDANNRLPSPLQIDPQIYLRVSYDRGGSFQDALPGRFGAEGEYGEMPWWANLGLGRDIVFELVWSAPIDTALNGIFVEATSVGS